MKMLSLGPRTLLDPVDDQRHLIGTLISLGMENSMVVKKVVEVYSPPRVTKAARQKARPQHRRVDSIRSVDKSPGRR